MPVIKAKALALCVCPVVATPPAVLAVHPPARHAAARVLHRAANRLDRDPAARPKVMAATLACTSPTGVDGPRLAGVGGGGGDGGQAGSEGNSVTVAVSTQDGRDAAPADTGGGAGPGQSTGRGGFGGDEPGGFAGGGFGGDPFGSADNPPRPSAPRMAGGVIGTKGASATASGAIGTNGGSPAPSSVVTPGSAGAATGRGNAAAVPTDAPPAASQSRPPVASSAPEPAMWLLLVAGFGMVGVVARGGRTVRPPPVSQRGANGEDRPYRSPPASPRRRTTAAHS